MAWRYSYIIQVILQAFLSTLLFSKQFTDIIKVAYEYVILQTKTYLQEPLVSTGLRPHVSLAADKSTPHRETNHAIMVILPVEGKRVALPIDAPIVYSNDEEEFDLQGGSGEDLAQQVVTVIRDKLGFSQNDMQYIRGIFLFIKLFHINLLCNMLKDYLKFDNANILYILAFHADGQYQANTFVDALHEIMGNSNHPGDPFFLTTWDVSHWVNLVMEKLRENDLSAAFLKRLIQRSNKLHVMFGRGRGFAEYKGVAASLNLKALHTVTFSTTQFFSSSYEQWDKIYCSYKALIEAFMRCREKEDDEEEETKYQVNAIYCRRKTLMTNGNSQLLFEQQIEHKQHCT